MILLVRNACRRSLGRSLGGRSRSLGRLEFHPLSLARADSVSKGIHPAARKPGAAPQPTVNNFAALISRRIRPHLAALIHESLPRRAQADGA